MEPRGGRPLYRLIDAESQEMLVLAEDVQGFFVDQDHRLPDVGFVGVRQFGDFGGKVENAAMEVMDYRQNKIGEYYVGRVDRRRVAGAQAPSSLATVVYRFHGGLCEYPEAHEVWQH